MRLYRVLPTVFCALVCATPALAGSATHKVVPGESLWSIAARYGVSVGALEARNHLTDASILQIGQTIVVPTQTVVANVSSSMHDRSKGTKRPQTSSLRVRPIHGGSRIGAVSASSHQALRLHPNGGAIRLSAALWAATHDGIEPPQIDGIPPFEVARRMMLIEEGITRTAMRYLGVPYMWGGTTFSGVDCSGFVQTVFARNGISLPRMADGQFSVGRRIAMSLLMPGDLVFFETYTSGASHVGIYLGHGKFIHASLRGVVIDSLGMGYYAERYIGARRLVQ